MQGLLDLPGQMALSDIMNESPNMRLRSSIFKWVTENITEPNVDDLVASIVQPDGKTKKLKVYLNEALTYSVAFLPKEVGMHQLNVLLSKQHLPGSPFEFNVFESMPGGHEKVLATGSGLTKATVGDQAKFHVITSESGEGKMEVSIHGPSKADISYLDREDGTAEVAYVICEPGKYNIHIKFDGQHIPGSPYEAIAMGKGIEDKASELQGTPFSDVDKIKVVGDGIIKGKMRQKVSFHIDCSKCVGIVGPSGPCEDIVVKERSGKNQQVVYVPEEVGEFVIVLKWGDDNVPGCPFRALIS